MLRNRSAWSFSRSGSRYARPASSMASQRRARTASERLQSTSGARLGREADRLDTGLDRAFDRSRLDDRRGKDEIHQSVKDFRQTSDRLRDRVNGHQSDTLDVEEVLRHGVSIDGFMQRYQLSAQAEQNWLSLRGDLDGLARAYNVAWSWSNPGYPPAEPARASTIALRERISSRTIEAMIRGGRLNGLPAPRPLTRGNGRIRAS